MQGWRISMEDAHSCILDLRTEGAEKVTTPVDKRLSFFGVYDGHGGDKVAIYTGEHLHNIISKQEAFRNGDLEKAIKDGFLATDRAILSGRWLRIDRLLNSNSLQDPHYEEEVSGCTACVGLITKSKIFVVCGTYSWCLQN